MTEKETCGEYFTVIIWRQPGKPWRTNRTSCYCTLDKGHRLPHHDEIKGFIEDRDYSDEA